MALDWSPHMALGIPQLDEAHQLILLRLGRLERNTDWQLRLRLPELLEGMEQLFLAEEVLMQQLRLPTERAHRAQHDGVRRLLNRALEALNGANPAPAREALGLLPHWYMHHLCTMDLELSVAAGLLAPTEER